MTEALTTIEDSFQPVSVDLVRKQVNALQHLMNDIMQPKVHYGVIPGCGDKPTLFKAGAEKLCLSFQLSPEYQIDEKQLAGGHREYQIVCRLKALRSGAYMGEGLGVCSTMEAKYRYRNGERKCPHCGKPAIIKGKSEYGGGWICFKKKNGCGAKWDDGAQEIEGQIVGKIEHDNPADYYNTVIKMAKKRAQVDAVLTATAASDIFTQDIEEMAVAHTDVIDATFTEPSTTKTKQTATEQIQSQHHVEHESDSQNSYMGRLEAAEDAGQVRELMKSFSRDQGLTPADKTKLQLKANEQMNELKSGNNG